MEVYLIRRLMKDKKSHYLIPEEEILPVLWEEIVANYIEALDSLIFKEKLISDLSSVKDFRDVVIN